MFLDRDPDIDVRSFELLPSGRLLVIVDDAHDDVIPVAKVITGIHAANPDATVLLALRPYGEPRVRLELRTTGVHMGDVFRRELEDLDIADAESLAREILGGSPCALRCAPSAHGSGLPAPPGRQRRVDPARELGPDRLEGDSGMSRISPKSLRGPSSMT